MEQTIEAIAITFDIIGKILIVVSALGVHNKVQNEHKLDKKVFNEMHRERFLAVIAVAFMATGYVLKMYLLYYV